MTALFFWADGSLFPHTENISTVTLNSALAPVTLEAFKINMLATCVVNKVVVAWATASSTDTKVIFGLYDSAGNKVLDTGLITVLGSAPSGQTAAALGSPVTITPGVYYFAQGYATGGDGSFQLFGRQSYAGPTAMGGPQEPWSALVAYGQGNESRTFTNDLSGGSLPSTLSGGTTVGTTPSGGQALVTFLT